jgi:hypothetical protein
MQMAFTDGIENEFHEFRRILLKYELHERVEDDL